MIRARLGQLIVVGALAAAAAPLWPSDRWPELAPLAYVPPAALVVAAVMAFFCLAGADRLRGFWVALALLCLCVGVIGIAMDNARLLDGPKAARGLRVVHWNVATRDLGREIARLGPDVVCLSEAGPAPALRWPGWDEHRHSELVVASRFPVRRRGHWWTPDWMAVGVDVLCDPPLSVLLVDVRANPHVARRPVFESLSLVLASDRYDVVVGDFNTPAGAWSVREALGGYRECYREAGRGIAYTWPAWAPVLRIDQAYVRAGIGVGSYSTGTSRTSDHRYQLLVLDHGR